MTSLVQSIFVESIKNIVLWISNHWNDWAEESAMISSNDGEYFITLTITIQLNLSWATVKVTPTRDIRTQKSGGWHLWDAKAHSNKNIIQAIIQ